MKQGTKVKGLPPKYKTRRIIVFGIAVLCIVLMVFIGAAMLNQGSSSDYSEGYTTNSANVSSGLDFGFNTKSSRADQLFGGGTFDAVADTSAPRAPSAAESTVTTETQQVSEALQGRKVITSTDLSIQTFAFEEAVDGLKSVIAGYGGYIQDSNIPGKDITRAYHLRRGYLTVRIPAEKLDAFLAIVGDTFNVMSTRQSSQDITDSYMDTEMRVSTLKIQEQLIIDMLKNSNELQYMLELQRELADLRYEIESLTGTLRQMDGRVSLSTVSIDIQEVTEYIEARPAPVGFWQEIEVAWQDMLENAVDGAKNLILLVVNNLIMLLVIAAVFWFCINKLGVWLGIKDPNKKAGSLFSVEVTLAGDDEENATEEISTEETESPKDENDSSNGFTLQ